MASGLSAVFVLALCVLLPPCVSADNDCKGYKSTLTGFYYASQKCYYSSFCCGTCDNRYCCYEPDHMFDQDDCDFQHNASSPLPVLGIVIVIVIIISIICVLVLLCFCCCRCCSCCCLHEMCRELRPVRNSTTHTTATLPVATPGQPAGYHNPLYQDTPMQPGYGPQPTPQSYGPQPTVPLQPYTPGPPPAYQDATCPAYPPNPMPYSQAAFTPSQTSYPLQPPAQPQVNAPQFNAPPSQTDSFTQPAYNPDYVGPQHKTG